MLDIIQQSSKCIHIFFSLQFVSISMKTGPYVIWAPIRWPGDKCWKVDQLPANQWKNIQRDVKNVSFDKKIFNDEKRLVWRLALLWQNPFWLHVLEFYSVRLICSPSTGTKKYLQYSKIPNHSNLSGLSFMIYLNCWDDKKNENIHFSLQVWKW